MVISNLFTFKYSKSTYREQKYVVLLNFSLKTIQFIYTIIVYVYIFKARLYLSKIMLV